LNSTIPYQLLADIVLALHLAVVLFVVGGLVVILAGNLVHWQWVNKRWFRFTHLGAILFIIAEAWLEIICPLTIFENWLREKANAPGYRGSFIEHWLHRIMYVEAPWWLFAVVYSLFGLAVLATWWYFPPSAKKQGLHK